MNSERLRYFQESSFLPGLLLKLSKQLVKANITTSTFAAANTMERGEGTLIVRLGVESEINVCIRQALRFGGEIVSMIRNYNYYLEFRVFLNYIAIDAV